MSNIKEYRPLILRSNRFLGSALVERGLITSENLENANEKLLEIVQAGDIRGANLLNILLYDLNVLDEEALIENIVEEHHVGLVDLSNYSLEPTKESGVDMNVCWATYTMPFDRVEDFIMIATAYYLSKPAMTYWEEKFDGHIIWYVCSLSSVASALERAQQEMAVEAEKAAAEAAKS